MLVGSAGTMWMISSVWRKTSGILTSLRERDASLIWISLLFLKLSFFLFFFVFVFWYCIRLVVRSVHGERFLSMYVELRWWGGGGGYRYKKKMGWGWWAHSVAQPICLKAKLIISLAWLTGWVFVSHKFIFLSQLRPDISGERKLLFGIEAFLSLLDLFIWPIFRFSTHRPDN